MSVSRGWVSVAMIVAAGCGAPGVTDLGAPAEEEGGTFGGFVPDGPGLTGTLWNGATDTPVANATIEARRVDGTGNVYLAFTDASGMFFYGGLDAGTYWLTASVGTHPCVYTAEVGGFALGEGQSVAFDFRLPSAGESIVRKTLVVNFDPIIEAEGGRRLTEVMGWNDPRGLQRKYADTLAQCSGNRVHYVTVDWIDVDGFPELLDGFRYDDDSFFAVWNQTTPAHQPEGVDYLQLILDFGLSNRVNAGEIDEVVMWAPPFSGFWESQMIGPTSYFVNSPKIVYAGDRNFIVMGLNPERGVAEAIHSYGHRTESILSYVYGDPEPYVATTNTTWDRFAVTDREAPGYAGCGSVHVPPNGVADYDYANATVVPSRCDQYLSWGAYSVPTDDRIYVSGGTWLEGNDPQLGYLKWWYRHLPAIDSGVRDPDGRLTDWWQYTANHDRWAESR